MPAYDWLGIGQENGLPRAWQAVEQALCRRGPPLVHQAVRSRLEDQAALATIRYGDSVICFNFRTYRLRGSPRSLPEIYRSRHAELSLTIEPTQYDQSFKGSECDLENDDLISTLGEIIERHGESRSNRPRPKNIPCSFFLQRRPGSAF